MQPSSAAGQVLLHDGTDSFDNKAINVMGTGSSSLNYTATLPMMFGGHIYTVASVEWEVHYVFSGYNADGTNANDPSLYLIAGHTYIFDLAYAMVVILLQLEQEEGILEPEQISHQVMVEITLYILVLMEQ